MRKSSLLFVLGLITNSTSSLDLPPGHSSIYQNQKTTSSSLPKCYGYEENCPHSERYDPSVPHSCPKNELSNFWQQGDFGYVKNIQSKLFPVCLGKTSSLFCSPFFQYCKARNLYLNFVEQKPRNWPRHPEDLFQKSDIGGNCDVDPEVIKKEDTKTLSGGLRAWHYELRHFSKIKNFAVNKSNCDVIINKPVFFMKWDQGDNLYHRLCDFLNLYITQHVNGSIDFNKDILIVKWDWTTLHYTDYFYESIPVFTQNPIVDIKTWFGKRICVSSAVFSLLPRMLFGIYYNTQLANNCFGSSLIRSFVDLFLHRLKISQDERSMKKTRVTFLIRSFYPYRNRLMFRKILNQDELIDVMESVPGVEVQVVDFQPEKVSFSDQIKLIRNTDILVSIHGAGLTHLLFLPDWGIVFEVFDCEAICYRDLARLRGVRHVTWEDQSKLEKHLVTEDIEKTNLRYYNYSFDRDEFERLFLQAIKLLENNNKMTHTEL